MAHFLHSPQNETAAQTSSQAGNYQTRIPDRDVNPTTSYGTFAPGAPSTGDTIGQQARFAPIGRNRPAQIPLNHALLSKANELLDGIEYAETDEQILSLESIRCVLCELWKSAAASSLQHQSLLTLIQMFLVKRNSLTVSQAHGLRGAFNDLSLDHLSEQHLDIIRSGLIDEGHNPLVALSDLDETSE